MAETNKKPKAHVYGTVTFSDLLSAALFDRKASAIKTGLHQKDFVKSGSVIGRLYRRAGKGDNKAIAALDRLVVIIEANEERLAKTTDEIQDAFSALSIEDQLPSRPSANQNFNITWNNAMFLTMVEMLRDYDAARVQLTTLLDRKQIDHSAHSKLGKQLISPVRAIVEQVFRVAKESQ